MPAGQLVVVVGVAVAVDGAEDHVGVGRLDARHDGLVVEVAQRRVLLGHRLQALGFQVLDDDEVGRVATDNNYAVWLAFGNHYWPALYFADAQGRIRHHHFGEGEYAQSEMVIQQLLAEAGSTGAGTGLVSVDARWGLEAPADWATLRSQENYTGYTRTAGFAAPGGPVPGMPHLYTIPVRLGPDQWALLGDWTMADEATTLNAADGQIACRFHARDLNLVMGSAALQTPVRCRVLIDGQPPGDAHGSDVDRDGNCTVTQQRVYQLIRQPGPITDRTFDTASPTPAFRLIAAAVRRSGGPAISISMVPCSARLSPAWMAVASSSA